MTNFWSVKNAENTDAPPVLVLSNALTGGGAEVVAKLMIEKIPGACGLVFENDSCISIPGKRVKAAGRVYKGGLLKTLSISIWRVLRIQAEKIRVRPAVTVSHLEGPNFANMLTLFGGRRVLFVHNEISKNYRDSSLRSTAKKLLCKFLYPFAQRVVAVSPGVQSELTSKYRTDPSRTIFLPNPVDEQAIQKLAHRTYGDFRDSLCSERYLISVASLSEQKNHVRMLRIYAAFTQNSKCSAVPKLVLLGDGPLKADLKAVCRELGLRCFDIDQQEDLMSGAGVCFLGFQENPYRLLKNARMLLMTSQWEGLPICLLEAMVLGIPGIVTDCSTGIRNLWRINEVGDSHYWQGYPMRTPHGSLMPLVEEDSKESMSLWIKEIERLLGDNLSRKEATEAGAVRVVEFSLEGVAKIWEREILSLN